MSGAGVGALLVAFGPGPLWERVAGLPLLAWTVAAFERTPALQAIALMLPEREVAAAHVLSEVHGWRRTTIVPAQATPPAQLQAGCDALPATLEWLVIHDLARPLVTPELILAGLAAAQRTGVAVAGEPVKDTIKRVERGVITETLPRARLVQLQTPEVLRRDLALAALRRLLATPGMPPTPSIAARARAAGETVVVFPGDPENLRATKPDDLGLIAALLRARESAPAPVPHDPSKPPSG